MRWRSIARCGEPGCAAANLRWISSREISGEEIARYRGIVEKEEKEYQELFAKVMEEM